MNNIFSLDEPESIHCNNGEHLDLGAAFAAQFFARCFDWFRAAHIEGKKIRVVIEHDPIQGKTSANFSKIDDSIHLDDFLAERRSNRHKQPYS